MPQASISQMENEFQSLQNIPYLKILQQMLKQNSLHTSLKQQVQNKMQKIQNLTYIGIVGNQASYLEKIGHYQHGIDLFTYIGTIIGEKIQHFEYEVISGVRNIKNNKKAPQPQPQPQPSNQLMEEIQDILQNIDLPLSLFKRNDNYWSINNPTTLRVKQYLKQLHKQDKKFQQQMQRKKAKIIRQKQEMKSKSISHFKQQQQKHKQQLKQRIQSKMQELRKNAQKRQKSISQSVQFMKSRGKPLYQKIQKQFKQKIQIPSLQEKKKKLQQIRALKRSIPLQQISSHRQKYQKVKSQHQSKTIFTQRPQISYKSHFYKEIQKNTSMVGSRYYMNQSNETINNLSLFHKKLQYSRMIKQKYKPHIDPNKRQQLESRIKLMNKRRVRKINNKKRRSSQLDSDQEQDKQQSEPQSEPEPSQQEDQDGSDSDTSNKPPKDDQYQPTQKQRYKMGLNYLRVARQLAAKKTNESRMNDTSSNQLGPKDDSSVNGSRTANVTDKQKFQTISVPQGNQKNKKQKFVWVSKYDEEIKYQPRIQYTNYLQQMKAKHTSRTDKFIDTSRIKMSLDKLKHSNVNNLSQQQQKRSKTSRVSSNVDPKNKNFQQGKSNIRSYSRYGRKSPNIDAEIMYQTNIENQIRSIEQRAKNQQELLKYKRINREQKMNKKMQIDNAVVDTIKARLQMMNKRI